MPTALSQSGNLIKNLFVVYRSLSAQKQSEMIAEFQKLADSETDEQVSKFYARLVEILGKEKKENV